MLSFSNLGILSIFENVISLAEETKGRFCYYFLLLPIVRSFVEQLFTKCLLKFDGERNASLGASEMVMATLDMNRPQGNVRLRRYR